jgi:hypothetical protein
MRKMEQIRDTYHTVQPHTDESRQFSRLLLTEADKARQEIEREHLASFLIRQGATYDVSKQVKEAADSASEELHRYFEQKYYEATGENIEWFNNQLNQLITQREEKRRLEQLRAELEEYKKQAEQLHAENKALLEETEQLQDVVKAACYIMIQLWRVGRKEGDARPRRKRSADIQEAIEHHEATKTVDVVVQHGNEVWKEVVYTPPAHRETDEARPSPVLETIVDLGAENKVYREKEEHRRQQERARQVLYQKRYREEHPEEARVKEREKKARYRAKKKREAQPPTD